jgi:hypothetical protein
MLTWRTDLRVGDTVVAELVRQALKPRPASVRRPDGVQVGWISRWGGRFAGAAMSRLDLTPAAAAVPGPLLLAAVPALDAFRKAARAAQRFKAR